MLPFPCVVLSPVTSRKEWVHLFGMYDRGGFDWHWDCTPRNTRRGAASNAAVVWIMHESGAGKPERAAWSRVEKRATESFD